MLSKVWKLLFLLLLVVSYCTARHSSSRSSKSKSYNSRSLCACSQTKSYTSSRVSFTETDEHQKCPVKLPGQRSKLSTGKSNFILFISGPVISATYVHWGRTECPSIPRTSIVYSGKAAGSRSPDIGGGANYLCMPLTVEYASFEDGTQFSSRGFLHGIEYETWESPLESVHDHDVPCAVCLVERSSESLMIPGNLSCPVGWRIEYSGYLVSSPASNGTVEVHRTMFECLDGQPERFIGGARDGMGEVGLFALVEPDCSTLPCPPYRAEVEVSCVVCSKLH